ncbi:MAG: hypothetical protein ACRCYP_01835 [Alphaproteobacteria bacterium]
MCKAKCNHVVGLQIYYDGDFDKIRASQLEFFKISEDGEEISGVCGTPDRFTGFKHCPECGEKI